MPASVRSLRSNADPTWQYRSSEIFQEPQLDVPDDAFQQPRLNVPDDLAFQDARLLAAEARAHKAEQQLKEVDCKLDYYKGKAETVETRLLAAEQRARQAEQLLEEVDGKVDYWKERAETVENSCMEDLEKAEARARKAEQHPKEVDGQVDYWKEKAQTVERSCMEELEKAKFAAAFWEEAAQTAEQHAADVKNLDSVIGDVFGTGQAQIGEKHCLQAGVHHPFTAMLQAIRAVLDRSLSVLANQHELAVAEACSTTKPSSEDEPSLLDKVAKTAEFEGEWHVSDHHLKGSTLGELSALSSEKSRHTVAGELTHKSKSDFVEPPVLVADESRRITVGGSTDKPLPEIKLCCAWRDVPSDADLRIGSDEDQSGIYSRASCCKWLVSRMNWPWLFWDCISMLIVAYDCVMSPLHFFLLGESNTLGCICLAKSIFWAADLPLMARKGFREKHGGKLLLGSWLLLDLMLLGIDVILALVSPPVTLLAESLQGEHVLQCLRLLLLLRLVTVYRRLSTSGWRIQSQGICIMLSVTEVVVLICIAIHVAACGFYVVAMHDLSDRILEERFNVTGEEVHVRYFLCLQWSLEHFTLSASEVLTASHDECLYTVIITMIAAILLCLLVGRIISATIQSWHLHRDWQEQVAALRKYCHQRCVPQSLRKRVWVSLSFLSKGSAASGRLLHEHDVDLLACVPQDLRTELRGLTFAPSFGHHPFLGPLHRRLPLHACVDENHVQSGACIFWPQDIAQHMQFVLQGKLSYRMDLGLRTEVAPGPWFSEPVMWIKWRHRGRMIAVSNCELTCIHARRFQDVVEFEAPFVALQCRQFAKLFAEYAQEHRQELDDVYIDMSALHGIGIAIGVLPPSR